MIFDIFTLLILFQLKHFLADYPLQLEFMLQKFRPDWGFVLPLLAHASVHAAITLTILLVFAPSLWWLSLVDLIIHFVMDRIKAGPRHLGRFKPLAGKEFVHTSERAKYFSKNKVDLWCQHFNESNKKLRHNKYFWWSLGLDQMVHHITHYLIIFAVVMETVLKC